MFYNNHFVALLEIQKQVCVQKHMHYYPEASLIKAS